MRGPHHYFADFLLIVLLLIGLTIFLLTTPSGARSLAGIANIAGLGLDIRGVRGTLLKGLEIDSFSWRDAETRIELKKIHLTLPRTAFTNNALNIVALNADALNIYVTSSTKKGASTAPSTNQVEIPDIPIPNLVAEDVRLATLRVIQDRQTLLFKMNDMALEQVRIINHHLVAKSAVARPVIAASDMDIKLQDVAVDMNQPHTMQATGQMRYAHLQAGRFHGNVKVAGSLTHYTLQGDFKWDEPILGKSQFSIEGFGDYDGATISSLDLQHPDGNILASGKLSWVNNFLWNSVIYGKDIRTGKFASQWPARVDFNLESKGAYDYQDEKWSLNMQLKSLDGELNGYPVNASGRLTLEDSILKADSFLLKTDKNTLQLGGRITEPFNLDWTINARDVGQFMPGFKGIVKGKGVATGTTYAPSGFGNLDIQGLRAEGIRVDQAVIDLKAGANNKLLAGKGKGKLRNIQFQGFRADSIDFDFDGEEQPSLFLGKGNLQVKKLRSKDFSLSSAQLALDGSQKFVNVEGHVNHLKVSDLDIKSARLNAKGLVENHRISLEGNSKQGDFQINARGKWDGSEWNGRINKLRLVHTETGDWLLQKPVSIQVARDYVKASVLCIVNPGRGSLCTDTRWDQQKEEFISKGKLVNIPIAQINPFLGENLKFTGDVGGDYDITYRQHGIYGKATINFPKGSVVVDTEDGGKEEFVYHHGQFTLDFQGDRVDVSTDLQLDKVGKLSSQATVKLNLVTGKHKIDGQAKLKVTRLQWLQPFFPDISHLRGDISSVVTFKGLLSKPQFSGEVRLKNGHISVPDTGTEFSDITLLLKTTRPNTAKIEGVLKVKSSPLYVNGEMQIKQLNDWLATLKLSGKDLLFMDTYEAQIYASPDLSLEISPAVAKIKGAFHIPKATIRLSELPETAIYESDDVVFVGNKKNTEEKKPLRIIPNVDIILGKKIRFEGFGLESDLTGKIHLGYSQNTILSRGTLKVVQGEYRAYGQHLKIEHGVLVFHGALSNPGLDIRATRSIDDIKVGINLAGTLLKPKSSVFSDPPLSESDALSYLITGQSLSDASGDQAQLLLQAVRTLGISSSGSILNRIGGSVGLDDVNIITYGDYKKNKLQLGKRLGPRLYIRYITGLFDTFNKIAVDYKISNKWSLQAESGEEQGLDFIYNIDRH